MSESFMRYLDRRLDEWGRWYREGNWYGLGYPSCTAEHRMRVEGIISRCTGPGSIPWNEEAEEIEALVVEMATYGKDMAAALRQQYFGYGSLSRRAASIGISYAQFRICIGMARHWLAGRMSAFRER